MGEQITILSISHPPRLHVAGGTTPSAMAMAECTRTTFNVRALRIQVTIFLLRRSPRENVFNRYELIYSGNLHTVEHTITSTSVALHDVFHRFRPSVRRASRAEGSDVDTGLKSIGEKILQLLELGSD